MDKSSESSRLPGLTFVGILGLAAAAVWSTSIASSTWKTVRGHGQESRLQVTGSAKKRIISDTIDWQATLSVTSSDRTVAYKTLRSNVDKAVAFLKAQGIKAEEIVPQSTSFKKQTHDEVTKRTDKNGKEESTTKQIFDGYLVEQQISVRSQDVLRVEKAAREITSLLEQDITIESTEPSYYYSKLSELKVEMLAAAAKDARTRAENILQSTGGARVGKLLAADMGIININPANSTQTSEEGNNDTTSLDKDIITIVHATFALD